MEDKKHLRVGLVVHNTVVKVSGAFFRWWYNDVFSSSSEVTSQNKADVHKLLPILIGLGVIGKVTGINSKTRTIDADGS